MEQPSWRHSFWLVPASREQKFFDTVIRDVAVRYDAPIFEPHLTLCDGGSDEDAARQVLSHVQARASYALEIKSIEASARFTKTLFVRFRLSEELNQLRQSIGAALGLPEAADFDPHLSLLYKEISEEKKNDLRATIALPFEHVTFEGLALIAHPIRITSREGVEAWKVLARRSLAESSR